MEMERAHPREIAIQGFDASHKLQLSTSRFFRLNGNNHQLKEQFCCILPSASLQSAFVAHRFKTHMHCTVNTLTLSTGTCELCAAISRQITGLARLVKAKEQPRTSIKRCSSAAFFKTSPVVIPSRLDTDRKVSSSILKIFAANAKLVPRFHSVLKMLVLSFPSVMRE